MVLKMKLTNHEVAEMLDIKNNGAKSTGYNFPRRIYEVFGINSMLKSLFPDDVKTTITSEVHYKILFLYIISFYTIPLKPIRCF